MRVKLGLQMVMAAVLAAPSGQAWSLQDPTRPPDARAPAAQTAPLRSLELGSILLSAGRRVAVIDGVALTEGDTHDGIRVRRIYRDKVEILDQGRSRVLYPQALPQVRRSQ